MSIRVEVGELPDALAVYRYAFLLTVSAERTAKVMAVTPVWVDGELTIAQAGPGSLRNLTGNQAVTLVWPPLDPAGNSLIVDGVGHPDGAGGIVVTPQSAILHRPAPA